MRIIFSCFIAFIITLISTGCAVRQNLIPYLDLRHISDSLTISSRSDTSLILFKTCYCCIDQKWNELYLFKKDGTKTIVYKYSNIGKYNPEYSSIDWDYIFSNLPIFKNEKIKNVEYSHTDSLGNKLYKGMNSGTVSELTFTIDTLNFTKAILNQYQNENNNLLTLSIMKDLKEEIFDINFTFSEYKLKKGNKKPKIINIKSK